MTLVDICARLVELQAQRRALIRLEVSISNRRGSLVRRSLGFRIDLEEAERDVIRKHADRLIKTILGGQVAADAHFGIAGFVLAVEGTFTPIAAQREWAEDQMRALAQQLPVWPWVKQVAGVGPLGLAVIVGETGEGGNIGAYRTVDGFRKRHGYAVIDGIRQQKRRDPDEAKAHGYDPARHAECWAFLQDAMLRAQWRGATETEEAHAIGPYGELYALKKLAYLSRDEPWTSSHADRGARRVMAKEFLKDLYLAWRRLTPRDEIAAGLQPAETQVEGAGSGRASAIPKPKPKAPAASPRRARITAKPIEKPRVAGEAPILEPVSQYLSETLAAVADRKTRRRAIISTKPTGTLRGGGKK